MNGDSLHVTTRDILKSAKMIIVADYVGLKFNYVLYNSFQESVIRHFLLQFTLNITIFTIHTVDIYRSFYAPDTDKKWQNPKYFLKKIYKVSTNCRFKNSLPFKDW